MDPKIIQKLQVDSELFQQCQCRLVTRQLINDLKNGKEINELKIDVEYDMIYQRLYIGKWDEVPENYREMFVILSILKSHIKGQKSEDKEDLLESLYLADKGIIIGSDTKYCELLKEIAENVHEILVTKFPPKILPGPLEFESAPDLCDFDSIDQSDLSLESFWTKFLFTQKPVIIKNGITHWPAFEKWKDMNYLTNLAGFRTVPIEFGSKYDSENWSQGLFKFEEFLRLYFVEPNEDREVAYLAQHDLFEQIPRLKNDIKIPEYCAISENDPVIKAWIGPKNTISSMHTDPKQNLLCQVFGEKLLILAAPENSENLYPHDGILNNTSQIDPTNLNFEEFPLSKNVKFFKVHLKAGDILFIPKLWWHYVQSLTPSASVSFWFQWES